MAFIMAMRMNFTVMNAQKVNRKGDTGLAVFEADKTRT